MQHSLIVGRQMFQRNKPFDWNKYSRAPNSVLFGFGWEKTETQTLTHEVLSLYILGETIINLEPPACWKSAREKRKEGNTRKKRLDILFYRD